MRVAALKRLWEHTDPSEEQLLRRHSFYQCISERAPEVWARCGTDEERATALKDPKSLQRGTRPAKAVTQPWDTALAAAFGGLKFHNQRYASGDKPQGVWTKELKAK
jgi:hypothetical protein